MTVVFFKTQKRNHFKLKGSWLRKSHHENRATVSGIRPYKSEISLNNEGTGMSCWSGT